jgi:hypothetical protein
VGSFRSTSSPSRIPTTRFAAGRASTAPLRYSIRQHQQGELTLYVIELPAPQANLHCYFIALVYPAAFADSPNSEQTQGYYTWEKGLDFAGGGNEYNPVGVWELWNKEPIHLNLGPLEGPITEGRFVSRVVELLATSKPPVAGSRTKP